LEQLLERYRLRPIAEHDLERVRHWRNSDRIRAAMFNDEIITSGKQLEWFRKISAECNDEYLILEDEDRAVGLISFTKFDKKNNIIHWGFYIGEPDTPRGSGSLLCLLGLDYAFQRLGVRRVMGEVLASNIRSLRLHEQFGFEHEGCLRAQALKNGVYENVMEYGILADEWQNKRKEVLARVLGQLQKPARLHDE
jgi:UDP-4-amino-4,6-dideoxy-N-acetyl-beta-L-altrosamine N-acetyltransferase